MDVHKRRLALLRASWTWLPQHQGDQAKGLDPSPVFLHMLDRYLNMRLLGDSEQSGAERPRHLHYHIINPLPTPTVVSFFPFQNHIACAELSDNMALAGLFVKAIGLGAVLLVTRYVLAYLQSPLKSIPGPFLAKFSDIWRFLNHYGQTHIETQRKLHEQHGDIVRLGPNTVSVADASLIKTIYNTRGTYLKVSA